MAYFILFLIKSADEMSLISGSRDILYMLDRKLDMTLNSGTSKGTLRSQVQVPP